MSVVALNHPSRTTLMVAALNLAVLLVAAPAVRAGNLYVPNGSFESPLVPQVNPFAQPDMDAWEKSAQPYWYDPSQNYGTPWEDLMGTFFNVPYPGQFIDNCDGNQAAFIFALPGTAIMQDYGTLSDTDTAPSHAFNARFHPGRAYNLTVGVIGGGGNMAPGATLQISLYYRDVSNNIVIVGATNITNSVTLFPTNTHLVDFQVHVPTVHPSDAWAGQHIGVQIASTLVDFSIARGYWDVDNVRLVEEIDVPNYSFESPVVPPVNPFAEPDMDAWEKSAQPYWYDPSQNYNTPWEDLMGTFYNVPYPGQFIDNCDGSQAAFVFALPGTALFQDYNSLSGTNTVPTHDLSAAFTVGKAYKLTVGLTGGGGNMAPGATFEISLYYRDAAGDMVTVAATTITNTTATFPTNTHLVDFSAFLPGVKPTDPCAGQYIGIQLLSTVGFGSARGYWDLDNVRLVETVAPVLAQTTMTNGQLGFTLLSEPGLVFAIQAAPSVGTTPTPWTTVSTVTNLTGAGTFTAPLTNAPLQFYRARQL